MEEYKIETIFAALLGGVGVLWHQLMKQIGINRDDQREFTNALIETLQLIDDMKGLKEVIEDLKEVIKYDKSK